MNKGSIIRVACVAALWVIFCVWLVSWHLKGGIPITIRTVIFPIVTSGIIVFVPLYKKYKKNNVSEKGK